AVPDIVITLGRFNRLANSHTRILERNLELLNKSTSAMLQVRDDVTRIEQKVSTIARRNDNNNSMPTRNVRSVMTKPDPPLRKNVQINITSHFSPLCSLDRMKGLDVGAAYTNDNSCALLIQSIAAVTRRTVADFTGDDYESIYILAESECSADIHQHIQDVFTSLNLSEVFSEKLVGFCSDGASNMQGIKSGLSALLIKTHPNIVIIHYLAHRMELAFKDTVIKVPLYNRLMTLLLGLYYLYRKSPKLKQGLKRSFEALDIRKVMPTRVRGTRWVPHIKLAIANFTKGYKAIRSHLETASHANPKAENQSVSTN
ncbi:K1586-like protein, partial [Mya arenaria]